MQVSKQGKMKIQVDVISKELVKPSSPTPHHLRHLHFSFLDQLEPHVSLPIVHYYSNESTTSNPEKCDLLRKSLPQVLTLFYPLAGRIRNNSYAECNDEGFLYIEARAKCKLSDILDERDPANNDYFSPFRAEEAGDLGGFAQITLFECGGLAVSFGMCHKLGDASSNFTFLNTWGALARGDTKGIVAPSFGHAATFPPVATRMFDYGSAISREKLVTKIFKFDRSSIEALKAKYTIMKDNGSYLSSAEALFGFITRRYAATKQAHKAADSWPCLVLHPMDMRERFEPPMPKQSFGNIAFATTTEAQVDAKDEYGFGIAERIKDSSENLKKNFKKHQGKLDRLWDFLKTAMESSSKEGVVSFVFSSLQKFPMYETDFGWGKPLWVGLTPILWKNYAFLIGSRDGEGIEAWIGLNEEDMAKFEADKLVVRYTSSSNGRLLDAHSRL